MPPGRAPFTLPIMDREFKACPSKIFSELRKAASVVKVNLPSGFVGWLVLDYTLARSLFSDGRLSKLRPGGAAPVHPLFDHMLTAAPGQHARLRGLLDRVLPPELIRGLAAEIDATADGLAKRFAAECEAGTADLVASFARPLAIGVLCKLLGIPESDRDQIAAWSDGLYLADMEDPSQSEAIATEIESYLMSMAEKKRSKHDNALLSGLVALRDMGSLDDREYCAMAFLMLMAGHETSANLISSGVLRLLEAGLWGGVAGDPKVIPRTIEEILRYESPIEVATLRYAVQEMEVDQVRIEAGDAVLLGIAAANRDPAIFADPDRFSPDRKGVARHMAFGRGPHSCPGAHLARLEGEAALRNLAQRLPNLRLAEDAKIAWQPGLIMRGLIQLPLKHGRTSAR